MITNHENLVSLFETYLNENMKFEEKGNKSAATRARKALSQMNRIIKERRKEIQESKTTEKCDK